MSELKVKVETLPKRCEICHQKDCFDPKTNSCYRCKVIADLDNKSKNEAVGRRLVINQKWYCEGYHPVKIPLFFFILMTYMFLIFAFFFKGWILVTFILFTLASLYCCIMYCFNKTTLEVFYDRILIRYQPIPVWFSTEIPTNRIKSFYSSKGFVDYKLSIITTDGKRFSLLNHLSSESVLLIEKHLSTWLNK
jgi:hypothetical protein